MAQKGYIKGLQALRNKSAHKLKRGPCESFSTCYCASVSDTLCELPKKRRRAEVSAPTNWQHDAIKKERVLQVLRDANGEEVNGATSSSSSSYRSATGPISELRVESHVIKTPEQRDEYGFALHRLVSESAPAQITVPL